MRIFKTPETISVLQNYLNNPKIIIEIGAFYGHDTIRMTTTWPGATIHTFEPVPEIYQKLVVKTKTYRSIKTYNYALSDKIGVAQFHCAEKSTNPGTATQAGSLRAPKERLEWSPIIFPKTIYVQTITLDTWAKQNNIHHIDLLWIDTQGHELSILQHAHNILKKTDVIITEVGFVQAYEEQLTHKHVTQWLEQHNFKVVARDFKNETDWFFGNIICIKNDLANMQGHKL